MTFPDIVLTLATTFTGLMAGLFFSYSCSVVLGLQILNDHEYVKAMKSINKSIQNQIFFLVFVGILLILPYCTYLHYSNPLPQKFWLLLSATLIYFTGVLGTTIRGNIPLNNMLEKFNLATATADTLHSLRDRFENPWNNYNLLRTFASLLTFILVVVACVLSSKTGIA